ncbi:extracellular catalytic domain type 1 short-chain-length polyhydroxyalkanoate depolymerase [Actinoplanes sp. CA-252034]|uniref:extracellular catalytic domain type 1 short-chain-length polyhydroxyalkanoate depolymerase n=1 Tax=Actinoplanes sp. CA-252034 TaxID=3239906 RepID=UPI003D95E29A
MPRLLPLALTLLLLLPAGCTRDDDPIGPGSSAHTLGERTFRTYRPPSLPAGRAVPLVVVLHGGAGSGTQAERAYGWNAAADREGFLVAYPDGVGRSWNAGPGCCGPATRDGVDDVAFLEDVVAAVSRGAPVDASRVRATGMSNGAMMAYRLACDSTVFTAVAAVAGTLIGDCPHPAPVPVLHIHGVADGSVPWAGGRGRRDNGGAGRVPIRIDGPAVPDMIAAWRSAASCAAPAETVDGPVTRSIATCPGGRRVELISVAGAGHQWPGATPANPAVTAALGLDPPSTALDATAEIVRFFAGR